MQIAFYYGLIGAVALILGAMTGIYLKIKAKLIGIVMAFGAGSLIAALSFGLLEEAHALAGLTHTIWAFLLGGVIFIIGDWIIIKIGGRGHKRHYATSNIMGWGVVLGAILDGIPESLALGVSLLIGKGTGFLMLVAIFLSNLPEGISSAFDLTKAKHKKGDILIIWLSVALVGLIFVIAGYTIFGQINPSIIGITEAVAAGALLAMIASTMMPEAYEESGFSISLVTVIGFIIIFLLSKLTK
jgi:ZIP family zinc transporter